MLDRREAAALLRAQDDVLILTHRRPDGDTLGCAAALCRALRALGKTAWVLPNESVSPLFAPYLDGLLAPADFSPAFVAAVDVASQEMLCETAAPYAARVDFNLDHHGSNDGWARQTCLDADCAAAGELLYDILLLLGPVTAQLALPLYVAVSTDTGCFAYANTTPRTHRVAAALMETGFDAAEANKRHFRTKSYKRLRMESMLTAQTELCDDGETAIAAITLDMMRALGADEADVEDIAAFVGQLEGVKNAVTMRELAPGEYKFSLRTVGGLNASAVCALLGGGGHPGAAGCTVRATAEQARSAMLDAIRQVRHA